MLRRLVGGIALFVFALAAPASAATLSVCQTGCGFSLSQLQAALDSALPGDTVLLQQGATFTGAFTLRRHGGAVDVLVRTGVTSTGAIVPTSAFPAPNIRMTPALASCASACLARIVVGTNNIPALRAATTTGTGTSVGFWHLQWLEFQANTFGGESLIRLGDDSNTVQTRNSEIPTNFVLEQLYVHGLPVSGQKRGISIHANNVTLKDSYITDIKALPQDGQGVWINSSTGPYTVVNNYIEGGTEGFLAGGSSGCCRPSVTVLSATSASAVVLSAFTDLHVGQGLTIETAAAFEEYTEVASCGTSTPGAACTSATITVAPPLSTTPSAGVDVDWGPTPANLTFTKNYVTRPVSSRNPIVGTPQSVSATGSSTGGTLAAGTYNYRIVARHPAAPGLTARSTASVEVAATVSSGTTGSVAISWAAVTNATEYYVYGRTAGGENVRFTVTAPTTTFTDTGAAGVTENVPTSTGNKWFTKNSFELKNMDTATVTGNVFENVWLDGQTGSAVLITPANQDGGNDSTHIAHIVFENNIVRHAAGGFQISGRDVVTTNDPSGRTHDVIIRNNLIYDIDTSWGASNRMFIFTTTKTTPMYPGLPAAYPLGPLDFTIDHNTLVHTAGNAMLYFDLFKGSDEKPCENCVVTNNIGFAVSFGVMGTNGCVPGNSCWTTHTSGASVWSKNVVAGASCGSYPAETFCPSTTEMMAQFTDTANGDYRLKSTSTFLTAATDGTALGANIAAITPLTNIALSGNNAAAVAAPPPSLLTLGIPNGTVGLAYSANLGATCPSEPCIWSTGDGVPPGLTLTLINSAEASLTGTPSLAGTYTFTVTVQDRNLVTAFRTYTVTMQQAPQTPADTEPPAVIGERAARYNLDEGVAFRRATDPCADGEPVRKGDTWADLSLSPLKLKILVETAPACIWVQQTTMRTLLFASSGTNFTWNLTATADQYSPSNDIFADLTGVTECRAYMRTNQVPDGIMWIKFTAGGVEAGGVGVTDTDLGLTPETPQVSMNSAETVTIGNWTPIKEDAKKLVRLGFWGRSPSATVNTAVRNVGMICR